MKSTETPETPETPPPVLDVHDLSKDYRSGDRSLTVLREVSFSVEAGERVAIVGPSGSGKTTLLGLCAGLDVPSGGSVSVLGTEWASLDEDGRAALRGEKIGFVFQNFQLIPTLTALENIAVPLELRGSKGAVAKAKELLEAVGLSERSGHYPIQMSGGEQQRVALARAFVHDPEILFADEPTGNLDGSNGAHVIDLLFNMNASKGTTLILVTHDLELAERCDRQLRMRDGQLEAPVLS